MEEGFSDAISSEMSEGFDDHLDGEDLFTKEEASLSVALATSTDIPRKMCLTGEPMFKRECEFMRRPAE